MSGRGQADEPDGSREKEGKSNNALPASIGHPAVARHWLLPACISFAGPCSACPMPSATTKRALHRRHEVGTAAGGANMTPSGLRGWCYQRERHPTTMLEMLRWRFDAGQKQATAGAGSIDTCPYLPVPCRLVPCQVRHCSTVVLLVVA